MEALRRWCDRLGAATPRPSNGGWAWSRRTRGRVLEEHAAAYHDLGFTQFTLGYNGPNWYVSDAGQWLAWRDESNG